ncbi:hypothetical protein EON65_35175 [archaeon]|nr:MAG: hypothetical protein EON65_35175 [archaeon]
MKDIARQIGQIGPEADVAVSIQNIVDNLKLHEAWDLLEGVKNLVSDERRANRVKEVLEQHPQLIAAMYEIQVSSYGDYSYDINSSILLTYGNTYVILYCLHLHPLFRSDWASSCQPISSSTKLDWPAYKQP